MRWLSGLFLSVCACFGGQAQACDLALILAVDVSGSVDAQEYDLQMDGLAAALRNPAISEALVVAEASVLVIQWTGTGRQRVSVPWVHIRNFDHTDQLAEDIERAPRIWRNFSTAVGEAVAFAMDAFDDVPQCERKVVDVSGDGVSNEGVSPEKLHAELNAAGIIVNGLAIESYDKNLSEYFEEKLITGPGAFVMRAATHEEYPDRIKRKLFREITKQVSGLPPAADGRL